MIVGDEGNVQSWNDEKPTAKGFTIIEVVLVLAIAGLIFLMVFVAIPSLQRTQRNTQRKNDIDRFVAAVMKYQANNRGRIPIGSYSASGDGKRDIGKADFDTNFITRYIDSSCKSAGRTTDANGDYRYKFKECSDQFMDPDGTIYEIEAWSKTSTTSFSTGLDVNHILYFISYAKCRGTDSGFLATKSPNDFLIFYRMEGGAYYCADNT